MLVDQLETPALLIDLDVMERNLQQAADYGARHRLRLRPHTKTHKTPALAQRQLGLGAAGLTVAKASEGEVMLAAGPQDLLVAYPVLGARKLARLMTIADQTEITVALDSRQAAAELSSAAETFERAVQVLVEVDAGLGRVGVPAPEDAVDLARFVCRQSGLEFAGIAFYPGHIKQIGEETERQVRELSALLGRIRDELRQAGMPPRIVSGGSTPLLYHSHQVEYLNEIRPGTYIFNDRNTVMLNACRWEDCAGSIVTTVVSTARAGQVIVDGGSKTFSSDRCASGAPGFGLVAGYPDADFHKMNEEHGFILSAEHKWKVGDRLRVIPNHICVAVNLHEYIYGVRGDEVEEVWRVEGRGKLQ
jgi:D-serine deaminase-like pyridoxal phosphate-dependent protein